MNYSSWLLEPPSQANQAPVVANDSCEGDEDESLVIDLAGVLCNDTDIDGDVLTAALVSGPIYGGLILNPDASFTYMPAADCNGADSFTYRAYDDEADSNEATVFISVYAVNDAPILEKIASASIDEGAELIFTAVAHDPDLNDTLAFSLEEGAPAGAAIGSATGVFSWTPSEEQGPGTFNRGCG